MVVVEGGCEGWVEDEAAGQDLLGEGGVHPSIV